VSLSEDDLASELRGFARRFVEARSFEELGEMLTTDTDEHEYHNESDESRYFEVEASAMSRGFDENGEHIVVIFSAMDSRGKGQLGSAHSPMSCLAHIYANGHIVFGAIGNSAVPGAARDF